MLGVGSVCYLSVCLSICLSVCVRACVRACVVCVCVWMGGGILTHPQGNLSAEYSVVWLLERADLPASDPLALDYLLAVTDYGPPPPASAPLVPRSRPAPTGAPRPPTRARRHTPVQAGRRP